MPSLFEARRRLTTSATAISTCGQPNPSSSVLAGTEASTSFLFSTHHASPLLAKRSGDARRAAFRPFKPAPVLVPLAYASLPNRDTNSSASPPKLSPQSVVRIDEHGSKDRVKDASLRQARSLVRAVRCMPFVAHADDVPLLGGLRTSAVIGATACSGGTTACKADRPRPPFQRHPAKSAAFQKTRMPFTTTCAEKTRRDCSLRPPRRLSRSRRPHFSPGWGKCC
jgi:hypothetical protein